MWYVGLDEAGRRVGTQRFAHSHQGLHHLKDFLLGIAAGPEDLACIVETNHGLLITFLLEAGIPVYPVNPKTANKLRKTAGAKTDQIDASLLAKIGSVRTQNAAREEVESFPTSAPKKHHLAFLVPHASPILKGIFPTFCELSRLCSEF
ncbi:MAG: transposase [Ktedonobacteraceae bacterium]